MKTTRSIKISALNIAMHAPHSPQKYVSLFRDARRLRLMVPLGSLHGAMLGSLNIPRAEKVDALFTGEIYRFVKLDPANPWFNLQTQGAATEADVQEVKIPKHLLPHLQTIEFAFVPKRHELWFVSQDRDDRLGPQFAAQFFENLFNAVALRENYPKIEVTVIPAHDTIENMLNLHKLERITIELKRPNPDDAAAHEERWMRKLQKQHVMRQRVELTAVKGDSIKPDEETSALAEIASRNGMVSVSGKDAVGRRVEESTIDKPFVQTLLVDSLVETSLDVLTRAAHSG